MFPDLETLRQRLLALPQPPADRGRVALVVARPVSGVRRLPERAALTRDAGLEGDRWSARPQPHAQNQVTLIRADVIRAIADGREPAMAGDNLHVELDLSERNLPAGTRLRIGTALCEVTPLPHTGCSKFAARFGPDARLITDDPEFAAHRLRGIHVCVLEDGHVSPGDPVEVLSRPV